MSKSPKKNKTQLPHFGQLLTTKRAIVDYIRNIDHAVSKNTVLLIAMGEDTPDYHLRLYSVCARLYYLSRLVYRGKNGIAKLSAKRYKKELFEGCTETKDEVADILRSYHNSLICGMEITEQLVDFTYQCLQLIKALWCTFIACIIEQAYIPEFAYAFDYVIKHKGNLPMPEYHNSLFFPSNYEDFNYTDGIAAYFEEIMEGIF